MRSGLDGVRIWRWFSGSKCRVKTKVWVIIRVRVGVAIRSRVAIRGRVTAMRTLNVFSWVCS